MKIGANMIYKITIAIVFLFSVSACEDRTTTNQLYESLALEREDAERALNTYFEECKNTYKENPEVLAAILNSQEIWIQYRDAHCNAISLPYKGGTISGLKYGFCMVAHADARTQELWESYLRTGAGMGPNPPPPILPEPKRSLN